MGREKKKRRHSHHSRHDTDSDSSDDDYSSSSESDYDSSSYSDSSETSSSEEERRRRKARKKARRSSEGRRSSKTKKSSKKEKMSKPKAKKAKKPQKIEFEEISMEDYFLKSAEFRTWLSKERGVFFSDLSSEESRKLFKKFADKWNAGSLDKSYYRGIQSSAVGHDTQSNYQWKFASKVSSNDLKTLRDNVSEWSSSKDNFDFTTDSASSSRAESHYTGSAHPSIGPYPPSKEPRRMMGPSRGPTGDKDGRGTFEREERRERDRAHLKTERKDFRKRQETVLDELLPKATGREARVEKKKIRAEQRREREVSPDYEDSKVYGTSSSFIRDKVKARQEERQNRAHAAVQKISDYQAKEKARMEAMLQMAKANKKEGALW